MSVLVPYSHVLQRIQKGVKYQRAVAKWGQKAVDEISIPHLVYLFNILKKHGLLSIKRSKRDSIQQLEVIYDVNPVKVPVVDIPVIKAEKVIKHLVVRKRKARKEIKMKRVVKKRRVRLHFRRHLRRH